MESLEEAWMDYFAYCDAFKKEQESLTKKNPHPKFKYLYGMKVVVDKPEQND